MSITKIEKYRTEDGTEFDLESDAVAHAACLTMARELSKWLDQGARDLGRDPDKFPLGIVVTMALNDPAGLMEILQGVVK